MFYTAKLLKVCNNINKKLSASEFINNINLLVYRLFIECNYSILIKIYNKYLNWIKYYEMFFNPEKYKLIYLLYISYKFNIKVIL